jgi:hypothetical protein
MMQSPGCGRRTALATAIVIALAGSVSAAEPRLKVTAGGSEREVELSHPLRFQTGPLRLVATSLAGNVECGTVTAPADGVLQLELDGKRYPIKTNGAGAPVSYTLASGNVVLAIDAPSATACVSSNITKLDLVTYGVNGQVTARSRIAQSVQMMVPDGASPAPVVVLALADPMDCETFGGSNPGIDNLVTFAHGGEPEVLFGVDRYEYRLQEVNGRRELRQYPKIDPSGIPVLQCTSPGLLMGPLGSAGAVPGMVFGSSFEPSDAMSDVRVQLASTALVGTTKISFKDSPDAYVDVTVSNTGRAAATGIKVREHVPRNSPGAIHVVAGADAPACVPIPEDADPNPCAAVAQGRAFPLKFTLDRLEPGQGMTVRLHRVLAERGEDEQAKVEVGYAAFVSPAQGSNAAVDAALGNNSQWVNFAVS